jgi:phage terminase Nu1 subunit (DNA packaging protein)
MNKEQQKELLKEIMDGDARDGLYETVTNNHRLTAVEWIVQEVNKDCHTSAYFSPDLISSAIDMEKEQIIKAMLHALDEDGHTGEWKIKFVNNYYNQTFKQST